MLKRIYVDNYKSLVNFEVSLDEINLFLGVNGAGKTAVFEILRKIKYLVAGDDKVIELFSFDNCTRWQSSLLQTFELDIAGSGGAYQYKLTIEHDDRGEKARVINEGLYFDNKPLLAFEDGNAQLYRDNHSEGPKYPFDWSRSALASILPRNDNTKLTWFKEWMDHLVVIQIIPSLMIQDSPKEETQPSDYFENFVSWYRHVSQDQGLAFKLMTELKEILPGFEYFKFEATGEKHRLLKVYFNGDEKNAPVGYWFEHQSNRPSRIKSITVDKKDGIPISELVARGWVAEKAK